MSDGAIVIGTCLRAEHAKKKKPILWVTNGGDLCTADWAVWPAGTPACVCRLHAAAVRSAVLFSDEKHIRGVYTQRCAIQITSFAFTFTFFKICL